MFAIRSLLAFLRLRVEGGEDDDNQPDAAAEGTGDDTLDDLLDVVEPPTADAKSEDDDDETAKATKKAARLERELEEERAARRREAADRTTAAPAPRQPDTEFEREEAELKRAEAEGKDTTWLRWQIETNRTIRRTAQQARNAESNANDALDRARFERLEITKPKTYKRYAERIEQSAETFRRNGQQVPPRMLMLAMMLGQDVLEGKVNTKTARKAPASEPSRVDRGRAPGVRGDVSGKGPVAKTERDKRRERLENQII